MKKLIVLLLLGLLNSIGWAQNIKSDKTESLALAGPGTILRARGASYHKITWTVSGAPALCEVKLEKSEDGSTWTDLIAAQTCTSDGASALTAGSPAYVRTNVTSISAAASVDVKWIGYDNSIQRRVAQAATGSILATTAADVSVSWSTAMPDVSYAIACSILETSASGSGLLIERVRAVTATGATIQVYNKAAISLSGTVHCIAAWPGTQP